MSIAKDSKWVKDGEVVELNTARDNYFDNGNTSRVECVWFWDKEGNIHVLTERDFLKQYKPYEVVYEWQWAYITNSLLRWHISNYMTEEEFKTWQGSANSSLEYQRIDFTKRERK